MLDVKGPDTNNAVLGRFWSNTGARGSFIIRNGTGVDPTTFIGTAGGSEQLSIGTNNTEAIRILASNSPGLSRVGIGTPTPTHNLSVSSASTNQTAVTIANTSTGASRLYMDASNGDVSGSDYIWFGQNNDLTSEIQLTQNAGSFSIKSQPSGTVQSNLVVTQAGVVTLHNAGNVKLTTTGGGVDITGGLSVGNIDMTGTLDITSTYPRIKLIDTNHNDDYSIINDNGTFVVYNDTDSSIALSVAGNNNATFTGNVSIGSSATTDAKLNTIADGETTFFTKYKSTKGTGHTYGFKTNGTNSEVLALMDVDNSNRIAAFGPSEVSFNISGVQKLGINSAGNATFAGNVITTDGSDTATLSKSGLTLSRSNSYIQSDADNSDTLNIGQSSVRWGHVKVDGADFAVLNGGNQRFKIYSSGNAAFAGNLDIGGTVTMSASGNIFSDSIFQFLTTGSGAQLARFKGIQVSTSYGGTPPSQGILFGTDTNLYRDSSNVLKTDDDLVVAGKIVPNAHIELPYGSELRTLDSGGTVRTIARANSNKLQYGWSYGGEVEFMGGGSYTPRITINTDGSTTFAGDVSLADNKKLTFGAAPDFEIYHNSTTNVNHISSLLSRQLSISADTSTVSGNLTVNGNTQLGNALTDKVVIHGHLGIGHESYPKIAYPGQNALWGEANNSTTGQVVIDLPGTLSNYDMMYMEIDIYEYNSTNATKLIIGAHNWNSGGNSGTGNLMWYNVGVTVIGGLDKPVYLGWRNDGTSNRRVIAIGETNSTWSYPTIHVSKVHGNDGYNTGIDWVGDWAMNLTTSNSFFTKSPTTNWNSSSATTFRTPGKGIFGGSVTSTTLIPSSHIYLGATKRLYLDGGGNTYITESSADTVQIITDGTITAEFAGTALTLRNTAFNGNITASADSTHDIGSNGTRFANGYFDTLYGDGSNLTGVTSSNADTVDSLHASSFLRSDQADSGTGTITLADSGAADNPLILGSSSQTNYTLQQFQTSSHGTNNAYLIAYGAGHGSQAGNFAIKNTLSGKNIFFEVDNAVPLKLENGTSTVTGNLFVTGDLNITGDINSTSVTNLDVDDKTITIAKGAADSAAADGAGIVVDGASASILYDHTGTQWEVNKPFEVKVGSSAITMTEYSNGAVIWLDGSDGDMIGGDYYNVAAYGGGSGSKLSFGYGAVEKMYMDRAGNVLTHGVIDVQGTATSTFSGNVKIKNALIDNATIPDIDSTTTTVASVAKATYTAAFFDYVIKKGTNVRAGIVYACHDGTNVEFAETSTTSLGNTSDVTLTITIDSTNMMLKATTTSNDWSVKSLIRAI
jgi:hypothetical protein